MTAIRKVHGRRVWDSRGRPTVEAEITLKDGSVGRAIAPAGASRGSAEAIDLRDGGSRFGGLDVCGAVGNVNGVIADALIGLDAVDQRAVDSVLIEIDGTPDKGRLGGNALIAVSMAVAHAVAASAGMPLWRYLLGDGSGIVPLPEIQIFGGGAHARSRIDIQDYMIVAPAAGSFDEAIEWTAEVYRSAGDIMRDAGRLRGLADEGGYWPVFETNEEGLEFLVRAIEHAGFVPGEQVAITLDIAATEFGRAGSYRLALEDRNLDSDGFAEVLLGWLDRYPIVSIEDPMAEDDKEGMVRFTEAVGDRVQIVGDDYVVTQAPHIRDAAAAGACNTALIKPNQVGTLTETWEAVEAAREAGWSTIVSARSGETEDVTVAHLAVGWSAGQLKVGSFARSERMAKWNECLRIEEALADKGRFAGWEPLRSCLRGT